MAMAPQNPPLQDKNTAGLPERSLPGADALAGSFGAYLKSIDLTDYDRDQITRFSETFQRIAPLLRAGQSVLEIGGISRIAEFLRDGCGLMVSEYTKELREPFVLPSEAFDLILMLEVLEHLNDRHSYDSPIEEVAQFTASGAKQCLSEAFRVLRRGGYLVLTTPNATSIDAVGRILRKTHPFGYPPHVREYAPAEVEAMAKATGFTVEVSRTFFAWNEPPGDSREHLLQSISSLGYDKSDRGDDAYFVLRKPHQ
jgi:SAM-dependent methyltransferase